MTLPPDRKGLQLKIERLNDQEIIVVDDFVSAIMTPVEAALLGDSWLTSEAWGEGFLARLRAHHALSQEPLGTLQFESAFNAACAAAGWEVTPADGATNRFFDTTLVKDGIRKRLSLKASAAKDMKRESVHISKLTEAAWIQDVRRQVDRRDNIVNLFKEYRAGTDGIVMLRAFREVGAVDYQLVEIPTSLFEAVDNLSVEDAQKATIPMPPNAVLPKFKIRVDRSDAKITLTSIRIDAITVHGEWKLQGDKDPR
ncbi:hypothetical protein ARZXY2_4975 (plasmid) [Arthrobacter sp. ZXY-2]|nr:hypothetical protein ARZXY2_4975 [Arthrobacter sp. ZXY-2]